MDKGGSEGRYEMKRLAILLVPLMVLGVTSCSPTIKVEAPDKPITINLNVKIEHEVRVKIEKDVEDLLNKDSGLF